MTNFTHATFHSAPSVAEFVASNGGRLLRSGGTLSWRLNNPGNLRPPKKHKITSHIGVAITSNGSFLMFPDYQTGRRELERLLTERYALRTLSDSIHRFAPTSENDSEKYLDLVRRRALVRGDELLGSLPPEKFTLFVDAIEHIEGFHHKGSTRKEKWIETSTVSLSDGSAPLQNFPVLIRRGNFETVSFTDIYGELRPIVHSVTAEVVELYVTHALGGVEKITEFIASGPSKTYTLFKNFLIARGTTQVHTGVGSPKLAPPAFRYRVQPGDTLSRIARKFNTSVENIIHLNRAQLKGVDRIYPEQILNISSRDETPSTSTRGTKSEPRGDPQTSPKVEATAEPVSVAFARSQEGQGRPLALLPSKQRRAPWMEIAVQEAVQWAGMSESEIDDSRNYHAELGIVGTWKSGSGKTHDFASMSNDSGSPWCASFANYCLKTSGAPYVRSASSQFPITYPGKFSRIERAVYGALVAWRKGGEGHVAFVYGRDAVTGEVIALGGNQGDRITFMLESETSKKLIGYFVPCTYVKFAEEDLELTEYNVEILNKWIKHTSYKRKKLVNDR